jgi:hypothetical protein
MKKQLNEVKRMQQLAGIKINEIEGLDNFVSSLRAGDNKGFVIATDQDNDFEIDDEIRDILKKNGADENNFQIISKVNFDNLAGDQLKDMQDKLIIRKRK